MVRSACRTALAVAHDLPVSPMIEWLYNAATAEDDGADKMLKKLIGTYHEFKNLADIATVLLFNDSALAGLFSQHPALRRWPRCVEIMRSCLTATDISSSRCGLGFSRTSPAAG